MTIFLDHFVLSPSTVVRPYVCPVCAGPHAFRSTELLTAGKQKNPHGTSYTMHCLLTKPPPPAKCASGTALYIYYTLSLHTLLRDLHPHLPTPWAIPFHLQCPSDADADFAPSLIAGAHHLPRQQFSFSFKETLVLPAPSVPQRRPASHSPSLFYTIHKQPCLPMRAFSHVV